MTKAPLTAVSLLTLLSLAPTMYAAEEAYQGKKLPPNEVLLDNTVAGTQVFGKMGGDECYSVFFIVPGEEDLHTTTYCRLDNDFWIYQPQWKNNFGSGGTGIVMLVTPGTD